MRTGFAALAAAALLLPAAAASPTAATSLTGISATAPARPRVTVIGDSVATGLAYNTDARKLLALGLDLHFDVEPCRRLVETSCPYDGVRPPTATELIASAGSTLGDVVVVDVGYNDFPERYGSGIDRVMDALLAAGVKRAVWVTLREQRAEWHATNQVILAATARWPQLDVADWNAASTGRAWFTDGVHLNGAGALALARLLRRHVLRYVCDEHCQAIRELR